MYKLTNYEEYLMHHGVEHQKWGVRNGPPYPLKQAFAKTKAKYKAHQEKIRAKKRQKILNDPEKLYKHRAEFTEEEIRSAISKAQASEELKKQIPRKPEKAKRPRKEKDLNYAKLSMVDTPEKFMKNQKYLTKEEQEKAMDFLSKREQASKYKTDERRRNFGAVKDFSEVIKNLGLVATGSFSLIDAFASRNPNKLTNKEKHDYYIRGLNNEQMRKAYDELYNKIKNPDGEGYDNELYRLMTKSNARNTSGQSNQNNQNNNGKHSGRQRNNGNRN